MKLYINVLCTFVIHVSPSPCIDLVSKGHDPEVKCTGFEV